MKCMFTNVIVACVVCTSLANVTYAQWKRVSSVPTANGTHTVGPKPVAPPNAYAGIGWASSSTGGGASGFAWGMVDTRAGADGRYTVYMPPDTFFFFDSQSQTSGNANAYGTDSRQYQWIGYDPPGVCDAFKVARVLRIDSDVYGDADNGAITAGTVRIDGAGSAHVNIIVSGVSQGLDVNYDVDVIYTEGGSWLPSLTISFGAEPIALTWGEEPLRWVDDSFHDHESTPYNFERHVLATTFGVSGSAYVTVPEVRSSNNATQAKVNMTSSAGYLWTDSDYYGL